MGLFDLPQRPSQLGRLVQAYVSTDDVSYKESRTK